MLLQHIVGTLDAELDRLHRIRAIVVKLGRTRKLMERFEAEVLAPVSLVAAPEPTAESPSRQQPRKASEPRTYRRRAHHVVEPSAFAKAIPAGPVVISARELQDRKAQKRSEEVSSKPAAKPAPAPSPETPDRLVRDLSQRWLSSR